MDFTLSEAKNLFFRLESIAKRFFVAPLLRMTEEGKPLLRMTERGKPLLRMTERGKPLLRMTERGKPLLRICLLYTSRCV